MNHDKPTRSLLLRGTATVTLLVGALGAWSCGGSDNTHDGGHDGTDAGAMHDGSTGGPDGSPMHDGSTGADTGPGTDGSTGADTGPGPDGGTGPDSGPTTGGHNLACGGASFPSNVVIYQDIAGATLDGQSDAIMTALDRDGWAPAGARQNLGIDFSFIINCADASLARTPLVLDDPTVTSDGSDTAPVPLPPGGRIEGNDGYSCADGGDCHLLVYQGTRLYELYQANVIGTTLHGGALAVWDLTRNYWDESLMGAAYSRGEHCDGGNGGDLPIAPKLLSAEELRAAMAGDGMIHHALRFTIPNERIDGGVYVHPATHTGQARQPANAYLPYGARLRLRSDFNLAGLPNDAARVVARTLQHYGMYLEDGGNIYLSATIDASDVISSSDLGSLRPHDFQMVDGGRRVAWTAYECMHTVVSN